MYIVTDRYKKKKERKDFNSSNHKTTHLCPITPVLITMVLPSRTPRALSASRAIAAASSRPPLPVTAFAHPELMTTPERPALARSRSSARLNVTGAAWNLFFVKTAAAAHGTSDASSARSGFVVLRGFTPTIVPDTLNPRGYVPLVGTYCRFEGGMLPLVGAEYHRAEEAAAARDGCDDDSKFHRCCCLNWLQIEPADILKAILRGKESYKPSLLCCEVERFFSG